MAASTQAVICTLFIIVVATTDAYINNFRFKHSNVLHGDSLPFKAKLTGTYYLDVKGTPELSYLVEEGKADVITATLLKEGSAPPMVCTGEVAPLIANLDGIAHTRLKTKLTDLEKAVKAGTPDSKIISTMQGWDYYLDTSDSTYECVKITDITPSLSSKGYTFTVTVTFDKYKPIVFIDSLGAGTFNYKRSYDTKHHTHQAGNPIRFCGGVDYTGDMYTLEPRPKCPITSNKDARHYGRAIITVYKPNIVSVKRPVTRCVQHLTHVHSYENLFGNNRDTWRRSKTVKTTPADCQKWKDTKNACGVFTRQSLEEGDGTDPQHYMQHQDQCKFEKQFSQNNAATEYKTSPDLKYYFGCCGGSNDYEVRSALLTEGFMEVTMPTKTMVTPWMTIPKDRQNAGDYSYNNVTVIWKPFGTDELCPYVPRFRGEVSYIKYKHGDTDIPIDPAKEDERYTLFLVADDYAALFNVDSSQRIKDTSKLNCMPHKNDYRTILYQTAGDQIIMVTAVDEGEVGKHEESHIPEDMRHVGVDEQPHAAYGEIHYDPISKTVSKTVDDTHHQMASRKGDPNVVHDVKDHYENVVRSENPGFQAPPKTTPPKKPTEQDLSQDEGLAYTIFKLKEAANENLHARAIGRCFINQLDWDVYTQLLDLNPSRAISARLNMAVEASLGGNGFYNVKKCELAYDLRVVPTLRTSSEEPVRVNDKTIKVKDIVKTMGVRPDPQKCFAMPLVVFRSIITGEEVVGQLTLEGIVKIDKMSYVEACQRNKAFIFMVGQYGHFFFNYARNFTESADVIRNATERFLEASTPTPIYNPGGAGSSPHMINSARAAEYKKDSLAKIHTLTVVEPANIKEREYKHYPTGLFSNNLYSVAEYQSVSLGLMKLMEEQNYERFAQREFTKEWEGGFGSADSGVISGGFGELLNGDFFLKAGQGVGEAFYGLGGGVGQAFRGAGQGVGDAAEGLGDGISSALEGPLLTLGVPLIAVAILAIVGVIIYKMVSGKDKPPPPPSYMETMGGGGGGGMGDSKMMPTKKPAGTSTMRNRAGQFAL